MSVINDYVEDIKDDLIWNYILNDMENMYSEELYVLKDKKASAEDKKRASKIIYNAIVDGDAPDYVFEIIDGKLIYTKDIMEVLEDYGLDEALRLYHSEFGETPHGTNPSGALAFTAIENSFYNKYSIQDIAKLFLKEFSAKSQLKARKTVIRKRRTTRKPYISKSKYMILLNHKCKKVVRGSGNKNVKRITIKRTVGRVPRKLSYKRML